mgnify:CR=1 FL=1
MQFGNFKSAFLLLFFTSFVFGQTLEDHIYNAIDEFVAHPTLKNLEVLNLNEKAFLSKASTTDEFLAIVILNCNKGSFEMQQNLLTDATTSYEKAWQLYDKHKLSNYDIVEYCLKPLGTLYTKSGNFTLAENSIKKYIFIAEKKRQQATIISGYINLSIVYKSIGNYSTAIDLLQNVQKNKAVSTLQKKRIEEELLVNYIGLKKYEKANALLKKQSSVTDYQSLKTNAFLALQNNHGKEAVVYFERAKTAFFKSKNYTAREVAKLYVEEASIYSATNNFTTAQNLLYKALHTLLPLQKIHILPKKDNLYAENTFVAIFDALATIEPTTKKKIAYYDLSFYVSDLIKDQLVSQESIIIQQHQDRKRTEQCLAIFWDNYQQTKNASWIEKAFLYAEKSKNVVLKEQVHLKTLAALHPNLKNLQLQKKLIIQQELLINQLIRLQITGENENAVETINAQLATTSTALKNVNQKNQHEFKTEIQNELSITNLYCRLQKDQAQMLYFFWGNQSVYKFQINAKNISWVKIKSNANFSATLQKFLLFFDDASKINENCNLFTKTSFQLYQKLQLSSLQKQKNTIIIPDGLLNFVAFDALVTQKTTATNYSKIPFLVYQNKIAYQTNASFYLENNLKEKQNTIAGFFPVFENTNAELLYSKEEAKALQPFHTTLFLNENATKANFLKNSSEYSILHLSTHGTSGSFSTPPTLVFYDDLLLINELYALDNCKAQLVVLSACETGIGKLQKGEGAMSMARGFQFAGAKNSLFSLWKINDFAAAQVITNFYENYKKTNSFFESNYSSKTDYLDNTQISNAKKSPYYWSAFVYYGVVDSTSSNYYAQLFSGILLIVLLLCYDSITRFLTKKKIQKNKV